MEIGYKLKKSDFDYDESVKQRIVNNELIDALINYIETGEEPERVRKYKKAKG